MYAYIENNEIIEIKELPTAWRNISGLNNLDDIGLANLGWHPLVVVDPPYDSATQNRSVPIDEWDGSIATRTYTITDKTQEELDTDQTNQDLQKLLASGKDLALVLTELVQWTLDNTSMLPSDFTTSVKDAYLDLKAIADRVK